MFVTARIQNEIIEYCGTVIRDQNSGRGVESHDYTVCADEAADSANMEQLPIVLRFGDSQSQIREEFVDFFTVTSIQQGEALA